jgi:hypothetical protein
MFTENYEAKVNHFSLSENDKREIILDSKLHFYFVFNGQFHLNGQLVNAGDLIEIRQNEIQKLDIICLEEGNIIETKIEKK